MINVSNLAKQLETNCQSIQLKKKTKKVFYKLIRSTEKKHEQCENNWINYARHSFSSETWDKTHSIFHTKAFKWFEKLVVCLAGKYLFHTKITRKTWYFVENNPDPLFGSGDFKENVDLILNVHPWIDPVIDVRADFNRCFQISYSNKRKENPMNFYININDFSFPLNWIKYIEPLLFDFWQFIIDI